MADERDADTSEEQRRLATRIRLDVLVAMGSISVQGSVLGHAIFTDGSTGVWMLWGVVFVICAAAATSAMVRATRLSKRYRHLK
jgi:flagellar motor component MotA